MVPSLKYAVVERERRYVISRLPEGVVETQLIEDRYLAGTRLRLREVRRADGTVVRKLGQKVRLGEGPGEVACTNVYLDESEWTVLQALRGSTLRKTRHIVERDGLRIAVDEHADGTLVAEIDDGDRPAAPVPAWLDVIDDVSGEEAWTGAGMATAAGRRTSSG